MDNLVLQSRWGNQFESYVINNSKCQIPNLNPHDPDVLLYFKYKKYIKCNNKSILTYVTKTNNVASLHVNERYVNEYSNEGVQCCYSVITRANPENVEIPDKFVNVSLCTDFKSNVTLSDNFVLVKCKSRDSQKEIYRNVHAVVTINKKVQEKLQKFTNKNTNDHLSVLIIGVDSVSRSSMVRSGPITHKFLKENEWLEFKAYNKMGLNTFPNLMGILTGMNETTVFKSCDPNKEAALDKCKMIWYDYRKLGFVTSYGEDEAIIGTFCYTKKGFKNEPTDYYYRPYFQATEKFLPVQIIDTMRYCTGPETAGERILNLALEFSLTFINLPYFGFFWMNSFTHNTLNGFSRMDKKIADFFKKLTDNYILDNTIVIFLSDHGYRFNSPFLYTHTGWLEEKLPFFYMSIPEWFKERYPEKYQNLIKNTEKLTTPYDIYMTLQDILVLSGKKYNIKKSSACPNCKSLFDEIQEERSCEDVGIERQWCTCTGYIPISNNSLMAIETAKFLIKKIHELQRRTNGRYQQCLYFELKNIIYAGISDKNATSNISYFLIIFQTHPEAVFQGTASINWNTPVPHFQNEGRITRVDSYAFTSSCVDDVILKEFCYCPSKLRYITNLFLNPRRF